MNNYIAITIGPISNTMNFVSTPAALWASSYMFSYISRSICDTLMKDYKILPDRFLVPYPYWKYGDCDIVDHTGVGLLHDRIIFEAEDKNGQTFDVGKIKDIRAKVIENVNKDFGIENEKYLMDYITILGAEFTSDAPLLDSGKIMDSLELSAPFVKEETSNPILKKYTNADNDENRNATIKKIAKDNLGLSTEDWQLLKNRDKILSLSDIASTSGNTEMKHAIYYAVIRADGDNMSKIISNLKGKDDYRAFSEACLRYCQNVAKEVKNFGGMTVYSGGDDLLALVPCMNKDSKTIFDLITSVNGIFTSDENGMGKYITQIQDMNKTIPDDQKIPVPSLSFGVFISYHKFPLYEALGDSATLLFAEAKTRKNCIALTLQKHSGQTATVVIPNDSLQDLNALLSEVLQRSKDEKFLLSAGQKISLFKVLFDNANNVVGIKNVISNTFDAVDQKKNKEDLKAIEMYLDTFLMPNASNKTYTKNEKNEKLESKADVVCAVLRIIKFFTEKKGEEE